MPARLRPQTRRDDGAAMVEFAFVGVILVMFAFGIIVFGLLLSFKQDVTRAAAEGARVGAVAQPPTVGTTISQPDHDRRFVATMDATKHAVESFDQSCDDPAMTCEVTIHDCIHDPTPNDFSYWTTSDPDCVTVKLEYNYRDFPLIIDPPFLSAALPDTVSSTSVTRLNQ